MSAASDRPDDEATAAAGGDPSGWALPADAGVAAGGATGATEPTDRRPTGAYAAGATADGSGAGGDGGSGGSDPLATLLEKLPPEQQQLVQDKPEILAGGAFVVGFLFAKILKRIGGG